MVPEQVQMTWPLVWAEPVKTMVPGVLPVPPVAILGSFAMRAVAVIVPVGVAVDKYSTEATYLDDSESTTKLAVDGMPLLTCAASETVVLADDAAKITSVTLARTV